MSEGDYSWSQTCDACAHYAESLRVRWQGERLRVLCPGCAK